MRFPQLILLFLLIFTPALLRAQIPPTPKVMDDRLAAELVAMEPDIRTPTAIASDDKGRVWVLENNTHFRPKNYDGPPTDRIVLLENFDSDGRAKTVTPWADGFRDGMGILVLQPSGDIIVSTRSEVFRIKNANGKAADRTTLLKLDTTSNYPHNGLSGITRSGDKIYVGLGENFGAPWVLRGSDGAELRGSDEGGIFRMNQDGTALEWWAVGVWNPFGLAFAGGDLFALDNDPSGGSLCRLLHVVSGGDYGYRFRYGRTIDHPFLSWFGQIPGTLPPVCLTGEAPCGLLGYVKTEGKGLPSEYYGNLIGTTWTDRGLQRFKLEEKGVSYSSKPEWLIRGDEFRPSGIAQAPDGSLLVSDWVQGSYELHGKGRVWRVRAKNPKPAPDSPSPTQLSKQESIVAGESQVSGLVEKHLSPQSELPPIEALTAFLRGSTAQSTMGKDVDPFLIHIGIQALAKPDSKSWLEQHAGTSDPSVRLGVLLAMRRSRNLEHRSSIPKWLRDSDGNVRRAALQWVSEEGLKDFKSQLDTVLEGQPTRATFQAYLATLQMLASGKPDPKATVEETAKVAFDSRKTPDLRALALRLLPVDYAGIDTNKLRTLLADQSVAVRVEAIRILAARNDDSAQAELRRVAIDDQFPEPVRAEAVAGLAASASQKETQEVLRMAEANTNAEISRLAKRALGTPLPGLDSKRNAATSLNDGDPGAGRRIFFHPNGPRCFSCHTVEGRGKSVGPDLTNMGRFTPEELLTAIREPSREIAPAYAQWHIKTRTGKEGMGIDLFEDNKSEITLIDATSQKTKYKISEIASREVLPISMMPPGLDTMLTTEEVRDLISFLREKRE